MNVKVYIISDWLRSDQFKRYKDNPSIYTYAKKNLRGNTPKKNTYREYLYTYTNKKNILYWRFKIRLASVKDVRTKKKKEADEKEEYMCNRRLQLINWTHRFISPFWDDIVPQVRVATFLYSLLAYVLIYMVWPVGILCEESTA